MLTIGLYLVNNVYLNSVNKSNALIQILDYSVSNLRPKLDYLALSKGSGFAKDSRCSELSITQSIALAIRIGCKLNLVFLRSKTAHCLVTVQMWIAQVCKSYLALF